MNAGEVLVVDAVEYAHRHLAHRGLAKGKKRGRGDLGIITLAGMAHPMGQLVVISWNRYAILVHMFALTK